MASTSEVLFDCYEFRPGVYLIKAYVVGRGPGGVLDTVHHAAKIKGLGLYGIEPTPSLERALQLCTALRPNAIAEVFRKGAGKVPTLAGLLSAKHKERPAVLRHIHHRSAELLSLCQAHNWSVSYGLDARKPPFKYLTPFAEMTYVPRLSFKLTAAGCTYRFILEDASGKRSPIRYHEVKVITNHPTPGWLVLDGKLTRLPGLNGDQVKPFRSKDAVEIPAAAFPKYWREFIVKLAERNSLDAEGFSYDEVTKPDGLLLAVRPHPFSGEYYVYPEFDYAGRTFSSNDRKATAVRFNTTPPYQLTRIVRNFPEEEQLLTELENEGLEPVAGSPALSLPGAGPFGNLRWALAESERLRAAGFRLELPQTDGKTYTALEGKFSLELGRPGDWLDLRGRVTVGEHVIPFAKMVRYIQRGERRFPLPDGTVFLIPEEWFSVYQPGLKFAKVEGKKVRMARSHAPLLADFGLEANDGETARELAAQFEPSRQLRATLRPYQLRGARWLVEHYHARLGACLADDMGLGKTLQTITVLLHAKEQLGADAGAAEDAKGDTSATPAPQLDLFAPAAADEEFLQPLRALVVLPASLVFNWETELRRFAPSLTVHVHTGQGRSKDARILRRFDVLLTTYQTALRDQKILDRIDLSYIVLDESQQIKNRSSKIFAALNSLTATHRISLSGTPIENSLSDLWSQMQFINPGLLRGYAFFKKNFIVPIEQHDDELKKEQLRQLVGPHLLRRTKAEVAPDLPQLDVQVYYCEMSPAQRKLYEREKSAARNALLGAYAEGETPTAIRVVQTLTRLRQLANHTALLAESEVVESTIAGEALPVNTSTAPAAAPPKSGSGKFTEVLEQWDSLRRAGHKVLIFSSMVRHLELFKTEVEAAGQPYAWITGGVTAECRAAEVRRFQEDPAVQTFFISIKAGGTGLNLTAADYVFILDPWWNPSIEDQAIARAHRIGRTGNVFARKFLTKDSIEEKIHRLQLKKKQLAEDIIGKSGGGTFDRGELAYLLE